MAQSDSDREYRRWRVEHARDPDTESTPQTAAADAVGETIQHRKLGLSALEIIKSHSSKLALKLTRRSGNFEVFGSVLLELADLDELPTRLEIHQTLIDQGVVEAGELVSDQIEERRRELISDQLEDAEIIAVAITLCAGECENSIPETPIATILEEYETHISDLKTEREGTDKIKAIK